MNKRYKLSRKLLIFWTLFVGIGAILGATMMFIDPSGKLMGMDAMLPYFQVLPFADKLFQNLIFSGIMLLIINGLTNFLAFILILKNKKTGIILGSIFGITLMLWIVIQFVIFPFNFMSTAFFVIGLMQFITGYICFVGYKQSQFSFNEQNYQNIGKDKTKLVVFFSRTGYTKKLAYEVANTTGAEILEIKTNEKISGNLGFWWCGRFGMHKWGMNIEDKDVNLANYKQIILCSPTWVFSVSSPIREFCKKYSGQITNVCYYITHFMNCKFNKIATEMDKILQTTHTDFKSYRCRFGVLKEIR